MKRKIVAIGGGRVISPPDRVPQTLPIDKAIVKLAGKKTPKLLFIPTASLDNVEYCQAIKRLYANTLGCKFDTLLLFLDRPTKKAIREKILSADIIYVGGGNTLRMMNLWRKLGIDTLINQARQKGAVLCGLSAGAICWFRQGNSDSRKFVNEDDKTLIKVTGLNFVDALACPHYDVEKHRQPELRKMMQTTKGIAIALDNCAAIEINDEQYRIYTSANRKNAYKVYWHSGKYFKEQLPKDGKYRAVSELLKTR